MYFWWHKILCCFFFVHSFSPFVMAHINLSKSLYLYNISITPLKKLLVHLKSETHLFIRWALKKKKKKQKEYTKVTWEEKQRQQQQCRRKIERKQSRRVALCCGYGDKNLCGYKNYYASINSGNVMVVLLQVKPFYI